MGCFTVLDSRIKTLIPVYCKRNRNSAECRNTCQARKNRDRARQKTEMSLEEGLTGKLWFIQAEQQASKIISTAACQLDVRRPSWNRREWMEKGSNHHSKNLRLPKRKHWLRKGKWRGQGVGNRFMFSTTRQRRQLGMEAYTNKPRMKAHLKKINKTFS